MQLDNWKQNICTSLVIPTATRILKYSLAIVCIALMLTTAIMVSSSFVSPTGPLKIVTVANNDPAAKYIVAKMSNNC